MGGVREARARTHKDQNIVWSLEVLYETPKCVICMEMEIDQLFQGGGGRGDQRTLEPVGHLSSSF